MKTDLFLSCGHCWVFQICWHIECSTFTASSFRIWNSPTGIPSPLLALFVVMLSKAHMTSHSRMSGSRWVMILLSVSGSWRCILYSSVYSCHLYLISSASVRSLPFLSFIEPIFAWNSYRHMKIINIHLETCFPWNKLYGFTRLSNIQTKKRLKVTTPWVLEEREFNCSYTHPEHST